MSDISTVGTETCGDKQNQQELKRVITLTFRWTICSNSVSAQIKRLDVDKTYQKHVLKAETLNTFAQWFRTSWECFAVKTTTGTATSMKPPCTPWSVQLNRGNLSNRYLSFTKNIFSLFVHKLHPSIPVTGIKQEVLKTDIFKSHGFLFLFSSLLLFFYSPALAKWLPQYAPWAWLSNGC